MPSKRRLAREASEVAAAAHAHGAHGAAPRQSVKVKYTEGSNELEQEWFYETPHSIFSDQRQDERQRPKIMPSSVPVERRASRLIQLEICVPLQPRTEKTLVSLYVAFRLVQCCDLRVVHYCIL